MITIGSLFSGYGGLDLGVAAALNAPSRLAWHCEIDPAPARVLAHHHPGVPNLGDITQVQWADVEPVDVLTGGFPCQDLSLAGGRAGLREGTRSGLWSHMAAAIDTLRPSLVIAENVRGLLSARADSHLDLCAWCVGDDWQVPALRALGAVLGDLADLGYDAAWCGLRAADVGAPHGRFRVFLAAWPTGDPPDVDGARSGGPHEPESAGTDRGAGAASQDTDGAARRERWIAAPGEAPRGWTRADARGRGRAPAPDADGDALRLEPVTQPRGGSAPVAGRPRNLGSPAADADGGGQRPDLADVPQREPDLERRPAPDAQGDGRHEGRPEPAGQLRGSDAPLGCASAWGPYAAAVHRWEHVIGRVAPAPTERAPKGGQRLAPAFVEWLMGLPDGHVTAVPGITRNEQLRALGNGVVPQQAEAAVRWLLAVRAAALRGEAA